MSFTASAILACTLVVYGQSTLAKPLEEHHENTKGTQNTSDDGNGRQKRFQLDRIEGDPMQQIVTIDLSALRPSLPGLVLHKYGELAPKLVQVDLDILNPHLQPHIIWPQFQQNGAIGETVYDFENADAIETIPFLENDQSLISVGPAYQTARLTSAPQEQDWPDFRDTPNEISNYLSDTEPNKDLMILQQSLPLADEVIIPLDWEEGERKEKGGKTERNVYGSRGFKTADDAQRRHLILSEADKHPQGTDVVGDDVRHTQAFFGSEGWRPGKRLAGDGLEREGFGEVDEKRQFFGKNLSPWKRKKRKWNSNFGDLVPTSRNVASSWRQ